MLLKLVVGVVALGTLAIGGYFIVKEDNVRALSKVLQDNLESGDYLAALGVAGKIKGNGQGTPELEQTVFATARLLVADDIYHQAIKAAGAKRWVDTRALLTGSEAVNNPSFKYYEEARKLLQEAEALAAGAAHKTAVTISTLEEKARTEQSKRQELEQSKKKLEGTIFENDKTLSKSKAETAEARRQITESQKDAQVKQAALIAEQARARQLMEQVEKESKQKFFNEFRIYRDMAQKGREQLDNAVVEINSKRDITALMYIGQARTLFEEVKTKASDLRSNRTPTAYQTRVADLTQSLEQFLEASKQIRNSIIYIEEQGSAEFTGSFSKGKASLSSAASILSGVSDFLAGQ